MTGPRQIPIPFEHRPALERDDYLVTPANAEAVAWIDRWPDWPGPLLAVWGPGGCGKSHLAQVFLARTGGRLLAAPDAAEVEAGGAYVLEDLDRAGRTLNEEALFHLFNALKSAEGRMLITARAAPARWDLNLADLTSRLKGSPTVEITAPDDTLLAALLVKHFSDRQLRVDADVVAYMVPRMDRTFQAAADLVAAVDAEALARKRPVTVPLVRAVLEALRTAPGSQETR
ncbi:MAG: DNA replication protein [Rhodospirillales bacterium CG15_BIG_FIL_POST_REV_8_21_14_020_66_15]|nr:MAG: DNA replication protein [Rhodospirillales bacterium CG15_BIG_FIL_POST_REV_8_21_14_020_66_15]